MSKDFLSRQSAVSPIFAACIALACIAASPAASAYGTCTAYINADGSIQARRGESDCWIQDPIRIGIGVYKVGVNHPLEEASDPSTGALIHTLHPSICTATSGSGAGEASSVKLWPDLKPTTAPRVVPEGHDGTVTYTIRTHSVAAGQTLEPTDLDFALICVN